MPEPKSLKSINNPALWGIVVVDATILAAVELGPVLTSGSEMTRLVAFRAALLGIAPMAVLLFSSLLPALWKARLVFWRWSQVLPGHRAFSYHAFSDSRIDIAKLKKNVGAFPEAPSEQNTKWYGLLKKVESDAAIQHCHRQFLLLRDVAALSLILAVVTLSAFSLGFIVSAVMYAGIALFGIQYILAALGSRSQGVGLVCSVLALHSVKRRV